MKTLRFFLVLTVALLLQAQAFADDTDVFATTKASAPANILLIFDNGASFSADADMNCGISVPASGAVSGTVTVAATVPAADKTAMSGKAGGIEQCAMYAALSNIDTSDNVKIGMMMFQSNNAIYDASTNTFYNTSSTQCNNTSGGCLVLKMKTWNSTMKKNTLEWVRQWNASGGGNYNIKTNSSTSNGGVMQEAWAFFQGMTGISGVTYTAQSAGCGANSIIYIGNDYRNNTGPNDGTGTAGPKFPLIGTAGTASVASPVATTIEKEYFSHLGTIATKYSVSLGASTGTVTCTSGGQSSVTYSSSSDEGKGVWGINWAKYLNDNGIKTTTIALLGTTGQSVCNADYSGLLDQIGQAGGKGFIPTNDFAGLKAAVGGAVSSIIAENSVFASVSLPVSVNLQSEYLNQVFIGMFRPDASFRPRWVGNLKQYKLAFTDSTKTNIQLVDADGTAAINTTTGFVDACRRSFWTPSTVNTYWASDTKGTCSTVSGSSATSTQLKGSDYPDGNIVEKGAQAYTLRTNTVPSSRTVKTCGTTMATCTNSMSDFTTSLSPTAFGLVSTDTTTRDTYVNWARGQNLKGDEPAATTTSTAMRPYAHGDVVHSRPVAVDYGGSTGVVVYYGANDGMLHSVNGNQTTSFTVSGTTYVAGQELWSFMPPEFYGNIATVYSNSSFVYYKGTPDSPTVSKPYGMDGPLTALTSGFGTGSSKNYIFATMRRGGRAIYAFDVTTPTSPSLVWKQGCSSASVSSTDCSTGYSNMGQTWASVKNITTTQYTYGNGTSKPLLLVGGGYDTCEDTDTGTANNSCSSSKGSQIYVIDASDGSVVRSFPTVTPYTAGTGNAARGVISEATVINVSGNAKYAYIADLGGVVYRISFTGNATTDWTMTPIAKVGCDVPSTGCSENRKFMFQTSVVSADGVTFYVLLGSGDREKPTTQYTGATGVTNYFFAIKDQPASATYLNDACGTGNNYVCLSSLLLITASNPDAATLATKKGWYLQLSSTEQVVTSAITQYGITTFSTHTPAVSGGSCANSSLGTTKVYNVNYADASAASGTDRGSTVSGDGGLPPSPVAGTVVIDGTPVPFCIGCSTDSPLQAKEAKQASSVSRAKNRLYWFIQKN